MKKTLTGKEGLEGERVFQIKALAGRHRRARKRLGSPGGTQRLLLLQHTRFPKMGLIHFVHAGGDGAQDPRPPSW